MNMSAVLSTIGLPSDTVTELAARVAHPPPGQLDAEDGPTDDTAALALRAMLVAFVDQHRFRDAIPKVGQWLEPELGKLSTYDQGRYWHLRGLAAWRLEGAPDVATRLLNTARRLLDAEPGAPAKRYRGRVYDTFGQVLHQRGMLAEARLELAHALRMREDSGDRIGEAITLGNLGRLSFETAELDKAKSYFVRDLDLVRSTSPEQTRIQAQLLSHIGYCDYRLGDLAAARKAYAESESVAKAAGDAGGELYARLGSARVELAAGEPDRGLAIANEVKSRLVGENIHPDLAAQIEASAAHVAADVERSRGKHEDAITHYREAATALSKLASTTPLVLAEIAWGEGEAHFALGKREDATVLLHRALRHLDGTAADKLRHDVESSLKRMSRDAWLLHNAGRFVGHANIERLLGEAGEEGFRGEKQQKNLLFSDIRGFTTISEHLEPSDLIVLLNDFLSLMTNCIERRGGSVDKFIGDAVMAIFESGREASTSALLAALSMRDELERFNRRLAPEIPRLAIGIGVHGGDVIGGLIGSPQKREYTVIGDVVNTASRLEGMTKQLGASILVTQEVLAHVDRDRFLLRPLGAYAPKGRKHALHVFDVMGVRDRTPGSEAIEAEIAKVTAALADFSARRFDAAAAAFEELQRRATPTAEAGYSFLLATAREYGSKSLDDGWNGDIKLTSK